MFKNQTWIYLFFNFPNQNKIIERVNSDILDHEIITKKNKKDKLR